MDYQQIQHLHPDLFSSDSGMLTIITDPDEIRRWQKQQADPPEIGVVLQDRFITILRDLVESAPGVRFGYNRLVNSADLRGGKAVVAFTVCQDKVLLLHQFRHATRRYHYEVPRGFGEIGLLAEDNVRKEVLEEVQGKIITVVDLGPYHNNTGMESSEVELFFVELDSYGEHDRSEGKESVLAVDLVSFEAMIRDSQITDGFTIAAYTRAKLKGLLG